MTLMKKLVLLLMAAGMLLAVFLESLPAQSEEMRHDMDTMALGKTQTGMANAGLVARPVK